MNKYRTGKRPARHGAIRHKFTDFFDPSELPKPTFPFGRLSYFTEDDCPDGLGMLGNDKAGCCVWSGGEHEEMLWGALGGHGAPRFTEATAFSDYRSTGFDPTKFDARGNNPTDQGSDMVAAAQYRQKTGLVDADGVRHKIDGFLSIQVGNVQEIILGAFLFGAVGVGANLQADAEDQFDAQEPWTVTKARDRDGHYFPIMGAHDENHLVGVTWGRYQGITPPWLKKCMDEGIIYLSRTSLRANTLLTQRGMNWTGLDAMLGKFV